VYVSVLYLAAVEHRTSGFQRWAVAHCATEWQCRWWCPACKCYHCGTRSRTRSVCSGINQRRGSAPDLHTPSVDVRRADRWSSLFLQETTDCTLSSMSRSTASSIFEEIHSKRNKVVTFVFWWLTLKRLANTTSTTSCSHFKWLCV